MAGNIHAGPRYRLFGAYRFALAMLVLLQHGLLLLTPAGRAPFYALELGAVAVTAFFGLSGFIVAEALSTFYAGRPAAFLANRLLRVAPPYLAALALTVALDSWLYRRGVLLPLDAGLHGSPLQPRVLAAGVLEILPGVTARRISGQDFSFIPFAWTLRVEFAFYLAAALVAAAAAWRASSKPWVIGAGLAASYLGFALFAWNHRVEHGVGAVPAAGLQVICVPFFAFGLCIFFHLRRKTAVTRLHLLLVSCLVLLAFTYWGQRGHPMLAFQLPLLCVLFALLAGLAAAPPVGRVVRQWDRRFGELSYPLYVSHGAVLTALTSLSAARGALPYMAAIPLSVLLAAALHASVEQPLRAVRTRLRGAAV